MIIWIRNRRGWILVVFVVLIVVFAGGFLIGGVGSGNNYSLGDIINNKNGGGSTTGAQSADVATLRAKVKANPKDADSWSKLADAYLASASDAGKAAAALKTYLALKPGNADGMRRLATAYVGAYQYEAQIAQGYQQQASSLPGLNSSTFGGTSVLSSLSTDALQAAQADQSRVRQTELIAKAKPYQTRATSFVKRAVSAYGALVAAPGFATSDSPAATLFQYGQVAEAAGDTATAIKAYGQFIKVAPEDPSAAAVKQRITQLKAAAGATVGTSTQ